MSKFNYTPEQQRDAEIITGIFEKVYCYHSRYLSESSALTKGEKDVAKKYGITRKGSTLYLGSYELDSLYYVIGRVDILGYITKHYSYARIKNRDIKNCAIPNYGRRERHGEKDFNTILKWYEEDHPEEFLKSFWSVDLYLAYDHYEAKKIEKRNIKSEEEDIRWHKLNIDRCQQAAYMHSSEIKNYLAKCKANLKHN